MLNGDLASGSTAETLVAKILNKNNAPARNYLHWGVIPLLTFVGTGKL